MKERKLTILLALLAALVFAGTCSDYTDNGSDTVAVVLPAGITAAATEGTLTFAYGANGDTLTAVYDTDSKAVGSPSVTVTADDEDSLDTHASNAHGIDLFDSDNAGALTADSTGSGTSFTLAGGGL